MRSLFLSVLITTICSGQSLRPDPDVRGGYGSITPTDLRKHISVLASDSLEGRGTATPGGKKAANYIARVFSEVGLSPKGDHGSFFQSFDLDTREIGPRSGVSISRGSGVKEFSWWKDVIASSRRDTVIRGPVAFVGFIDAQLSESVQTRLAGHIVVALAGTKERAFETADADPRRVMRRLAPPRRDPGMAGYLVIAEETGPATFDAILDMMAAFGAHMPAMRLAGEPIRPGPPLTTVYLSADAGNELLRATGKTVGEWRAEVSTSTTFSPIFLDDVVVTIRSEVVQSQRRAENVIGYLEGSDPHLKDEAVVLTAHYDHMGITPHGTIFYGADDDGSGTSTLLELAEAFATNPVRPRRSLLFLAVTGEERGLLGSKYYSLHPVIPMNRTTANLNADMIGRVDTIYGNRNPIPPYTYVIGSDKLSLELDSLLRAANAESENLILDYTYNDEKDPNQYYRRSDHYNFAKHGVPVVFFFTGTHVDYHRPTDTADKIMYDRLAAISRVVYTTGWKVANFPRSLLRIAPASHTAP